MRIMVIVSVYVYVSICLYTPHIVAEDCSQGLEHARNVLPPSLYYRHFPTSIAPLSPQSWALSLFGIIQYPFL